MFKLECNKCGKLDIVLDQMHTVFEYIEKSKFVNTSKGINIDEYPDYMVYACLSCGEKIKMTLKDIETKTSSVLRSKAIEIKKNQLLRSTVLSKIDPDNGLVFCGKCSGYDGGGNCLVDVIKLCKLRNYGVI